MADILVVNKSRLITPADILPTIAALNRHHIGDFGPVWGVASTLYFGEAPAGAWPFSLQDTIDDPDALGYHVDENGIVQAIIDVAACKASGDDWRECLSHEMDEATVDPPCTRLAPDNMTMLETDDPVEGDSRAIDGIPASNFATPSYFDFDQGTRFDWLGYLRDRAPALRPGGYIEQLVDGQYKTILGERAQTAPGFMASRTNGRRAWRKRASGLAVPA